MAAPRRRLLVKLLASQALIVMAALLVAWFAFDLLATDAFMTLMKKFDVDTAEVEAMFRSSTRTTFILVGVGALLVVCATSYWLTRRMLTPLEQLSRASEDIAAGESARIPVRRGVADEFDDVITAFNEMAESLERNEQARRAMVVDVAHELRTPLTNLRGTIEALQDGLLTPDSHTFQALHDELLRLVRLTEDLLAAARAGSGVDPVRRSPTNLKQLLESTFELFRARLLKSSVELEVDIDDLPELVLADPDQLKQVFGNLLQNALQFSDSGSRVRISAVRRDGFVRIVFKNYGESIPPEDLPWIFEAYYRVDKSRTRDRGGAGIGLAIVKALVEAHGGKVGASSTADVTRVWVELPAA